MRVARLLLLLLIFITVACAQNKNEAPTPKPSTPAQTPAGKGTLNIKYVGNMGVLLSSGDKQVLIDAIQRKYKPAYVFPPPGLLADLEQARAPFGDVELVLVTHMHLDHFHPESVGTHLKNNPKAAVVSSGQVMGEISKGYSGSEQIKSQVREATPEWGKRIDLEVNGIKLALLGLRHVNKQHSSVQNLGYLVEIGGKKVLHVGDAEFSNENFAPFALDKEDIDVAILPQWFIDYEGGCEMARKLINAKHILVTHISSGYTEEVAARVKKTCQGADAFTRIIEDRTY